MNKQLKQPKFIPMSKPELNKLGWNEIDVLLVTGDAYVDHPSFGIAIIGRVLIDNGYRVGIIAQPDWTDKNSLLTLGKPKIACAITSGNLDSMLSIYTAARRKRREDSYSPGGRAGLKPPLAVNVYSNLAKSSFSGIPIIIGGIEASMRRIAHYDYWKDKIMPTILQTSRADILVYGMGEKPLLDALERIETRSSLLGIAGTAVFLGKKDADEFKNKEVALYKELPSYKDILYEKGKLILSHKLSEQEMNPYSGKILIQEYDERILVINKPSYPLNIDEIDQIYDLPFTKQPHLFYKEKIPAYEMIKDSITSVRGCPGGCSFCGLGLHQGRFLQSRSQESIIGEAEKLLLMPFFKGTISDIGGPTANAYGNRPIDIENCKKCKRSSCLFPDVCSNYKISQNELISLLRKILKVPGIKHAFINSGIRLDLSEKQTELMKEIIKNHVSGHLKVAPEHLDEKVLKLMRKNRADTFFRFVDFFAKESSKINKKQYMVPYFISNFPGADKASMEIIDRFLSKSGWSLQQVQDFIPLPMTIASAMYYEGLDYNMKPIYVNRGLKERRPQLMNLKKKRNFKNNKHIKKRN